MNKCLLDMDGVLTDFNLQMSKAHYIDLPAQWPVGEYDLAKVWGLTPAQFWTPANFVEFWSEMPWMSDGATILNLCIQRFGVENICICTSPSASAFSAAGKVIWLQKNLPQFKRQFMMTPVKHFAAHPNTVLVDDSDKNIDAFINAGGVGITVPRPWNRKNKQAAMGLTVQFLRNLFE